MAISPNYPIDKTTISTEVFEQALFVYDDDIVMNENFFLVDTATIRSLQLK
jgi:hypothetical protein